VAPEFSSGRYGSESRTEIYLVPYDFTFYGDRLSATLRVPYLSVRGPGRFASQKGGGAGRNHPVRTTEIGLGDVRLTGTYTVLEGDNSSPYLDVALRTILPTASSHGLGRGWMEQALRIDTGLELSKSVLLDASVGRHFALFPRKGGSADYWSLFAGLTWNTAGGTSVSVDVYAQDRAPNAKRPVLEVGAFLDQEIAPGVSVGVFAYRGLTRESVDWSGGFRLTYRSTSRKQERRY
jgi:hypothetical protein